MTAVLNTWNHPQKGKMPKQYALVLLFISVLCNFQPAMSQPRKVDFRELESTVREEMKTTNTPGAAVAVVIGDRVVFSRGFGVSNIETGSPVSPETLFRIASNTKMLTAAALVVAAKQFKINFNAPISTYIDGLNPKISQVTLNQLLSHTAGLMDAASDYGPHDDSALESYVRSWGEDYLFIQPGIIASYSNLSYDLAGLALEKITGKPYAESMSDLLFKPLGMNRTTLRPLVAMTYPFSQPHSVLQSGLPAVIRPFPDDVREWPSGAAFTNILDYARFAIVLMNGGMLEGKQVLDPAVVKQLLTPLVPDPNSTEDNRRRFGYGFVILNHRGVLMFQHAGAMLGFTSLFRMVPEHRFSVIVLANNSKRLLSKTMEKATDLAVPFKEKARAAHAQQQPMSKTEMQSYVGLYVNNPSYLSIELSMKDGRLFLRQVGSNEVSLVTKIGNNRFSVDGQEFLLLTGADGKVQYLYILGHALIKVQGEIPARK